MTWHRTPEAGSDRLAPFPTRLRNLSDHEVLRRSVPLHIVCEGAFMFREERELLVDLMRVCNQAPDFVLEFMSGDMPIEAEEAFAHRLVDVAELVMNHANARKRLVINGQAPTLEPEPAMMRDLGE